MTTYSLHIHIDARYVEEIARSHQQVVLTKERSLDGGHSAVIWVAFTPYQSNTVVWNDAYAVYASRTQVRGGAIVQQMASMDAIPGKAYRLQDNVFHPTAPVHKLSGNQYQLMNQNGLPLTFGLAQSALINGELGNCTPTSAIRLLAGQHLDVTPHEIISVSLMCYVSTSMLLEMVQGPVCTVDFTDNQTSHTVVFDAAGGGFRLVGPT